MRFAAAICTVLAFPLALAIPSPVSNSSSLTTRSENVLAARTSLEKGTNGGKNPLLCTTIIKKVHGQKQVTCVCFDISEDTCYSADSDKKDHVVEDENLISKVILQLTITAETCALPKHSKPDFDKGCCAFKCKGKFEKCGNKCIPHGDACATHAPPVYPPAEHYRKRNLASAQCMTGLTACPVAAGRGFECLDVKKDIESCGGCLASFGAGVQDIGQDCTNIPYVGDVSCVSGRCQINTCAPGFKLSSLGDKCLYSRDSYAAQQKYRL